MDKYFIKKIGKNIKKYREAKGLTQIELAVDADMASSTIGMIETAQNDMTLSKINSIAKALNIDAYKLLKFD
ncbi:MAG TPA: helix-turn-helix transcriptional regulator [Candidatus Gastranaerophilaceae bacterium]|nr:helix-turn-helix transcriptional regulator [Candidatus Gastranaerophilaceae bacterium]